MHIVVVISPHTFQALLLSVVAEKAAPAVMVVMALALLVLVLTVLVLVITGLVIKVLVLVKLATVVVVVLAVVVVVLAVVVVVLAVVVVVLAALVVWCASHGTPTSHIHLPSLNVPPLFIHATFFWVNCLFVPPQFSKL